MSLDDYLGRMFDRAAFTGRGKATECRDRFVKGGKHLLRNHGNRRDTFVLSRTDMADSFGLTDRKMRTLIDQWRAAGLIKVIFEAPNSITTYAFSDAVRHDLRLGNPVLPTSIPESPASIPLAASVDVCQDVSAVREHRSLDVWDGQTSSQTSIIRETTFISADATMKVISQGDKGRLASPNVPPRKAQTSSEPDRRTFDDAELVARARTVRLPPTPPAQSGRKPDKLDPFSIEAIFARAKRPVPIPGEDDEAYRAREEALAARKANEARLKAAQDLKRERIIKASATATRAVHVAKMAVNGPPPAPEDPELAQAQAAFEAQRAVEVERWDTEDPEYWRDEPEPPPRLPPEYNDGSCESEAWKA